MPRFHPSDAGALSLSCWYHMPLRKKSPRKVRHLRYTDVAVVADKHYTATLLSIQLRCKTMTNTSMDNFLAQISSLSDFQEK